MLSDANKASSIQRGIPAAAKSDPLWLRVLLTSLAILAITILVIIPIIGIFVQAFADGWQNYFDAIFLDADTRHAIVLTLTVAPCAVILNSIFGVLSAWLIARFRFRGRTLILTLIDIPFSVSPVMVGLMFVLLFGTTGWFGSWLRAHHIQILFSLPSLILATTFVTLPFVVRELIPVMEAIGSEEELAALSLGAPTWQIFRQITLPNIKWGLLYGILLCNARAMGEFGAVYIVSGHIAGETNTIPLQIEQLFQGFRSPAAFALATILTLLSLVTLILKVAIEQKVREGVSEVKADRSQTPII